MAHDNQKNDPNYRDRQYTSWTPWNSAVTEVVWAGPTYNAGPTLVDGTDWLGGYYTATWTTPVFDLRPDLRDHIDTPKNGIPIWRRDAALYIQIFGLRELQRAPTDPAAPAPATQPSQRANNNLSVWSVELANSIENTQTPTSSNITPLTANYYSTVRSITSAIPIEVLGGVSNASGHWGNANWFEQWSTLLRFTPPGDDAGFDGKSPVRYWQVRLNFRKVVYLDNTSTVAVPVPYAIPTITIQGAMY